MVHVGHDVRFDRMAEAIFQRFLEMHPVDATLLGAPGAWNRRLPHRSEHAAQDDLAVLHELLRELNEHRDRNLTCDRAVDLRLARGGLNARIMRNQRLQPWRRCPTCYVRDIVTGVHALLPPCPLPDADRHDALLARLQAAPAHLEAARRQLESPPPSCTEEAELCARGALLSWENALLPEIERVADPILRANLLAAMGGARAALGDYANWLQGILMARSTGSFAVGRPFLERLLAEEQSVVVNTDDLIALGQRNYQSAVREMKRIAASIDSGRPWSRVVEMLKARHPGPGGLIERYETEIRRARAFLEREGVVPLPAEGCLRVEATPAHERSHAGRAAYHPPVVVGPAATGVLWVTYAPQGGNGNHTEAFLRGHPIDGIAAHVVRNVWPGHHLRALVQRGVGPRSLRWLFPASSFEEGWALYASELMEERGYFKEDRERLFRMYDQLVQACLVMIDVELHTGRLGWTEAIEFLVHKAHLERPTATAEVRRACARPTLPASDIFGKTQIWDLREEVQEKQGTRFDLLRFHEDLLSHGPIPIELIRMEMGLAARGAGRRAFPVPDGSRLPA